MRLYFQHSNGEHSFLCEVEDVKDGMDKAMADLAVRSPKYKSYYQRLWIDENKWAWIDVGSYSEFYIIKPDENEGDLTWESTGD